MAVYLIEWIFKSQNDYYANSLTINYNNFAPVSIYSNDFVWIQEHRYTICGSVASNTTTSGSSNGNYVCTIDSTGALICTQNNPTLYISVPGFAPTIYSTTIAFCPHYMADFENGIFYYPIILNNFKFAGIRYTFYLNQYYYYISYSIGNCPYYYFQTTFIYFSQNVEYLLYLIYCHKVDLSCPPINYTWTLYKVYISVNNNSQTTNENTYNLVNAQLSTIISTNNLYTQNVKNVIPCELWNYFNCHYQFKFGFNYGLIGSIPSNNGIPPTCPQTNCSQNNNNCKSCTD
jgi:hypothetical protein